MEQALYDQIGRQYTSTRRPDPRIAAAILDALGDADSVVNVGAGAGAYEPPGRSLVAVEPSWLMIRQRSAGASGVVQASAEALIVQASAEALIVQASAEALIVQASAEALIVQATAEALPFRAGTFDAALAVLTLHHWADWRCGLGEMKRVADRLVIFTIEPRELGNFWLTESYFPEIVRLDRGRCPSVDDIVEHLGICSVDHIAVPHDCVDGFLAAFWRRPEAYLDPKVRAGMSGFALLDQDAVDRGVARLKSDLESGEWARRFGHVMSLDALDVCYRLLVTTPSRRQ